MVSFLKKMMVRKKKNLFYGLLLFLQVVFGNNVA